MRARSLEEFDFAQSPHIPASRIRALAEGSYLARAEPVLAGLRNPGQRSIEIAIWDSNSGADIEELLRRELQSLIVTP